MKVGKQSACARRSAKNARRRRRAANFESDDAGCDAEGLYVLATTPWISGSGRRGAAGE